MRFRVNTSVSVPRALFRHNSHQRFSSDISGCLMRCSSFTTTPLASAAGLSCVSLFGLCCCPLGGPPPLLPIPKGPLYHSNEFYIRFVLRLDEGTDRQIGWQ